MYNYLRYILVSCIIGIVVLVSACKEKLPVEDGSEPIDLNATTVQLDSNLVAFWDFDDNTAKDKTGHGFDGILKANFSTPSEGTKGSGLKFNGVDNWFEVEDNGKN
ncbi:MAG: hypothetical protein IPM69_14405 [Ignavibacteria bacterium]|nr:hypothetical protein [Ignavibacteria bacterium]